MSKFKIDNTPPGGYNRRYVLNIIERSPASAGNAAALVLCFPQLSIRRGNPCTNG